MGDCQFLPVLVHDQHLAAKFGVAKLVQAWSLPNIHLDYALADQNKLKREDVETAAAQYLLAQNGTCASEWADWWCSKMELFDGIQENIALTDLPQDGCAIVHSDSAEGIQRLNQEAGKAMARGVRAGLTGLRPRVVGVEPGPQRPFDVAFGLGVEVFERARLAFGRG